MPRILLVEDNELNREMLSRRLLRKGFEVLIAEDGLTGVAMAGTERPDLILMDMSLPGIDGWEATRRLKADPVMRATPVIALTAHAMSDDRAKALAAGCDEFDTKPVDLTRLLDKMTRLLEAGQGTLPVADPSAHEPAALAAAEITLPAVTASLSVLMGELKHFCEQAAIDPLVLADLQVVLDEVLANVVRHAYPPEQPGPLRMRLRHLSPAAEPPASRPPARPAAIEIVVSDQGKPFNPLDRPAPDLSLSWEDRPIGGLGIHLIRQMTDHQSYTHTPEEGNRLCMVKHLS